MNYECLIAGLPELKAGAEAPITMEDLRQLLDETLRDKDKPLLQMLMMDPQSEAITSQLETYDDDFLQQPAWWEDARQALSEEDLRMQLCYEMGLKSQNSFLRAWFQYNQDLNNILVATICRKHGLDVSKAIVGDNEVAKILRKNLQQKDFGLAGVMDDYQEIMALVEITNLMERERAMDVLRFAWIEEKTRMICFSIENVLAYYLQAQMLNRWSTLNVENGEQMFREIVADMKKGVNVENFNQ